MIDMKVRSWKMDVIALARELIAFNTVNPPGNESEVARFVGSLLSENGFEVEYVPLPEGVRQPSDLYIDPLDENKMYLACWPHTDNNRNTKFGGLYTTTDGGKKWNNIFDEEKHVHNSCRSGQSFNYLYSYL